MNNSLFLHYYNTWRENPESVVFAPVADYFLMYGRVDDAFTVCTEGLKHNPDSVSGRMVLAKAHLAKGQLKEADEELVRVLDLVPTHSRAQELKTEIYLALRGEIRPQAVAAKPQPKAPARLHKSQDMMAGGDPPLAEIVQAAAIEKLAEIAKEEEAEAEAEEEWDVTAPSAKPAAWQTVTMAKIYAAQGHDDKARSIYRAILTHDPANEAARDGLHDLGGGR